MGRYKRLIWDALRDDPVVGRDARGILAGLDSEGPELQVSGILKDAEPSLGADAFSLEALFPETLAPVIQPPAATVPQEQPPIVDPLSAETMFGSLLRDAAPSNAIGGKAAVSLFDATPVSEDLIGYGQLLKELSPSRSRTPDLTERLLAAARERETKDAVQSFDDPSGWLSAIVGEADARRTKEPSMNLDKLLDVFKANADKNFVQRVLDPQKSLVLDEGNIATHRMSYSTLDGGKAMMYPTIVEKDGELVELSPKDAVEYARKTGEYIVLPEKAAEWATQNYKRLWDRIGPTEPDKTDIRLREREFQQRPTQAEDAFQTGLIEGLTGIKMKPDEDLRPSGKIAKAVAGGFGELVGWSPYFSPAGKAAGAIGSLLNLGSKAATRAVVGALSGAAAAGARKTVTGAGDADSMAAAAAGGAVAAPVFGAMSDFIFQKLPGMWGRLTGKTKMQPYEGRTETGGAEVGGESGGAGVPLDLGRYTRQDYVTFLQEMGNATQKGGFDPTAFTGNIRGDDAALFYGLYNESGSFQQAVVQAAKGKGPGRFWISQGDAESAFRFVDTLKAQTPKTTAAPAQQRPATPNPVTQTPPIPQEAPKPSGVAQTPEAVVNTEVVVETPSPPAGETTRQQKRPEVLEAEVVTDAADGGFAKRVEGAPDEKTRDSIFQQEGAVLYPDLRPEDQVAAGRNAYLVSNGTMSQTEADKLGQMAILTGLWQKKGVDIPPEPAEHETPTSPKKVENASQRQIVPVADAQANVANAGETPQRGMNRGGIPILYSPEDTKTADLLAELEKRGSIVTLKDGRKEIVLHPGVEKETPVVESRAADAPQEIDTTPQASEAEYVSRVDGAINARAKDSLFTEKGAELFPMLRLGDQLDAGRFAYLVAKGKMTPEEFDGIVEDWRKGGHFRTEAETSVNAEKLGIDEPFLDKVTESVLMGTRTSIPNLQRDLRIGFTKAQAALEVLEKRGVVGPVQDDGRRMVLKYVVPASKSARDADATPNTVNDLAAPSAEEPKSSQMQESKPKREPWQKTREEYSYVKKPQKRRLHNGESSTDDDEYLDEKRWSEHKEIVRRALNEGKDVPANVLSAYPDLVKEKELKPDKASREPWQMTRNEYELDTATSAKGVPVIDARAAQRHEYIVKLALIEGKPVPDYVLKDYPELAKLNPDNDAGSLVVNPQSDIMKEFGKRFGNLDVGGPNVIPDTIAKVAEDKAYRNAMKNNDRKTAQIEHKAALERVVVTMFPDQAKFFKQFQDNPAFREWFTETSFNATYEPGDSSDQGVGRGMPVVIQSSQIEPVIPPEARTDDRRRDDTDNAEPLEDELPEGIQGAREERPDGSDGRREDDAVGDGRAEAGQPGDVGQGGVDGGEVSVLPQEAVRPGRGNSGVQGVLGGVGGSSGGRKVSGKKEAVPGVGDEDAGGSGTNTADGGADGRDSSDGVEGESGRGNGRDRTVEPSVEQPVADQKPNDIREGGKPSEIAGENPGNFVITESLGLGEGTDGEKISRNLAAIRTLRTLQKENRYPTREEQAVMARYVGWGGLKPVFDIKKKGATDMYGRAQTELRKILTKEEYDAAAKTVTDAHYTAKGIVDAMWRVVRHMGFSGGRVLEPTVGTGNFIGLEPADLAAATEWHASEIDTITSRLAAALYPSANVLTSTGFEHANFAEGAFDLAIGNPPFGRMTLIGSNPNLKHLNGMKIHNYIIAKTGTHLRPGGVMAMVVTHRFLDTANPEAREFLAKSFRFLGAFRLPNDAFKANAGTSVVTDVVFFQKLRPGEKADKAASWLDVDGKLENGISVNRYYQENPAHILGNSTMNGKMNARHGEEGEYTVESDGRDLGQAIDDLIAGDFADLAGILEPTNADRNLAAAMLSESDIPIGGMLLDDKGKIMRRDMNDSKGNAVVDEVTPESLWKDQAAEWEAVLEVLAEVKKASSKGKGFGEALDLLKSVSSVAYKADGEKLPRPTRAEAAVYTILDALEQQGDAFQWTFDAEQQAIEQAYRRKQLGQDGYARLKGMLDLRNRVLALNLAERTGAHNIERLRSELNVAYDAFVKKNGFINDPRNFALLGGDIGAESGLEMDYERAVTEAQSQKTGAPVRSPSAKKADILKQRISWPEKVIDHADSAEDALKISLSERGKPDIAFMAKLTSLTPSELIAKLTGGEKPQLYLNPATNEYEHADAYLSGNVKKKLHEAQLAGLEQNIKALEAVQPAPKTKKQIRPNITGSWMPVEIFKGFLEALGVKNLGVQVLEGIGRIIADGDDDSLTDFGMQFNDGNAGVIRIFNAAAAGKTLSITRKDSDGRTIVLEDETARVNAILTRMSEVFEDWAYSDEMRSEQIVDAFNRKMNTHVDRKYDGVSYLKPVGASPSIKLRSTQINAAWRMIQSLNVLLDHVVGAGKTFTIITGVMERRRLGLSKKPLIVVPNHLVTQWAQDFYKLYPSAKILAASQADFTKKNRRRLFARIATGDFDAIVIGHSSMKFIESPVDDVRDTIQEQIRLLEEALEAARENKESKRTVAQIQERLKKYEQKLGTLTEQTNANKDAMGLDFKALGIDYLAVDEAHEFKNLEYMTSADRVSGMNDPHGSQKAFDLYIKVRGLQRRGGGIVFATGTPISNSIVEIYTIMKYLAHDDLVDRNQLFYDAWAGAYAKTVSRLEYNSTQKLAFKRVLAGLNNLSALSQIYKGFADTVLMTDLKRTYREEKEESNRQTGANERTDYPVPQIEGGGRRLDTGAATALQKEFTDYLIARYDAVKKAGRDKEYRKIDNPLVIMTDAKKASLDPRIIDPRLPRDENGKVMRSARNIKAIYDEWSHKRGAQLVFCDLSVPSKSGLKKAKAIIKKAIDALGNDDPEMTSRLKGNVGRLPFREQWDAILEYKDRVLESDETSDARRDAIEEAFTAFEEDDVDSAILVADTGFSVYDDLKQVLCDMGIPETEIQFIHDYESSDAKQGLFDRVKSGYVRVLIGSSAKMGAGMNVQTRLVALHHLDAPWRPSDMWQREGRIIRQGNTLYWEDPDGFRIRIYSYGTEETSDTVQWQILERKAAAIEQFRGGDNIDSVTEEGSDADQYADFMAASTGNPVFRLKLQAEKRWRELEAEISGVLLAKQNAQSFLQTYETRKANAEDRQKWGKAAAAELDDLAEIKEFDAVIDRAKAAYEKEYDQYVAKKEQADAALKQWEQSPEESRGDKPSMPSAPRRPGLLHPAIQAKSTYAVKVKDAIEALETASAKSEEQIPLGELTTLVLKKGAARKNGTYDLEAVLYKTVDATRDIGRTLYSTEGINFDRSTSMMDALLPDSMRHALKDESSQARYQLGRLKEIKERSDEVAKIAASVEQRDEAKRVVDWYSILVSLAEREADVRRGGKFNRFIAGDHRRKVSQSAKIELHPFDATVDGERYSATGIQTSKNRLTYHQAVRESDGASVVLMEADHNPDKPAVYEVLEQPESLRIQDDEIDVPGEGNEYAYLVKDEDAKYMDAVERGDMETAQRMVDEAAEKAGFSAWKLWHGSKKAGHTIFDLFFAGKSGGQNLGVGVYFSESKKWASVFAGRLLSDPEKDAKKKGIWYEYDDGGGVIAVYGPNIRKILDLGRDPKDRKDLRGALKRRLGANPDNPSDITEKARALGYEGIASIEGTDYQAVIFDTTKIKSADPVTYDDNGNVIPLSKRFDAGNEDIRYAHGGGGRMPLPKERADAEPMKLERIRALVGQLARWRFGRISERGALGVHKPRDQVIRTKGQYDFQIALHELGHNLARKMGLHKNLNKAAMLELETMGAATSPAGVGKSYRINEGIAQFVQAYALDDANAKKQAPAFFQIFEKRRSAVPELSELMEEIFNAIRDYFAATPQKRLDAAVFSARDKDPREKGIRRRVKAALYYGYEKFFDDLLPVRLVTDQIRETYGGPLPDELNLYAQFRTLSGYMKRADQDVDAMLGAIRGMGNDDYKALTRYLIAQRSLDYFDNKMIPGTLSKAESQRVINETPASVAAIADEIREAYNRMVDRTLLSSGIVSQDQLDAMRRKWPHYVPFVRDMGDEGAIDALVSGDTGGKGRGKKITNISSPIKRAKGLADENERTRIEDPVEVMVHNAVVFHGLAARNEVGQMMVHAARTIDGLGWLAEELDDAGANKRDAAFWVWHDGVKKYYATDPDIYAVVTALTSQGNAFTNNAIARFVEGFATVFKLGTTRWNPAFPFVNFSRDAFTVSTQSKSFAPPFSHTVRGLAMILKNDPILAEAIEEGVFYSALTSLPRGSDMKSIAQEIHRAIRTGSAGAVVNALLSIANGVGKGNENVEIGPKIDEYRRLRAQGMAKKEAAMRAREVNTDFARAGSWGRVINRYVPFFNPSMQGLDKAARTFRENPQAALLKCLLYISLPSLLLRLWILSDDDREKEYQEFPSRLRDMYWLIPTGKGDWKRLPKPFELGVLFGSSVERVVTLAAKKNQAFRGYAKSVQEAMTPSLMIQIFAPWLETWANRSMFYDRPIVGKSREGLPEELQYTATTTETAKLVGRLFKISPMKVDHIWRGYTGTVGANALSAVEAVARSLGALPESKREARRWSEAPFINAFTAIPYKGSESLSRFYDVSEEMAKKLAGAKAENKPFRDADIAMEFAKARRMLSTLWKDMENIRASDLPPVEKRDKMDKLTLRAVDFARNAMARYDRVMERRND